MKVIVNAQLPSCKNFYSTKEWHVLESNKQYPVDVPSIKVINNAFVTPQGLVLKNGRLVKGCAYNISGHFDANYGFEFWKLVLEQYLVSTYGRSLKKNKLPEDTGYFIIHSKWFNYFFWVTDSLPRLQRCIDAGYSRTHKLLIPNHLMLLDYVTESLKAFQLDIHVYDSNDYLSVGTLILPESREWSSSLFPAHIQQIRQHLLNSLIGRNLKGDRPSKLYVTRRSKSQRAILNEQEVIEFLVDKGFTIVDFEDYGFWDQLFLVMQSDIFISMHGAGITNAMFMPEGSTVIEIFNEEFFHYYHRFPYWKLCSSVGLMHYPLISKSNNSIHDVKSRRRQTNKIATFRNRSINVDLDKLKLILSHISNQ